jgi:hypothetical protein
MFWQVPSWLGYLSLVSVLALATYVLAFSLIESSAVLGFLVFLSLIFPKRLFRDKFVVQGGVVLFLLSLGAYLFQRRMKVIYTLEIQQLIVYPIAILAALLLLIVASAFILERVKILARLIQVIADRMTVFAIIYIPLGLLGLVVVIVRNLR